MSDTPDLDARLEEFVTVKEYAARWQVCEKTVRRWIAAHKVEAERTGARGHIRIPVYHGQQAGLTLMLFAFAVLAAGIVWCILVVSAANWWYARHPPPD